MNILQAFSSGFRRAMSEWKMIFLLYAANLLVSIPLAMALQANLASGFGPSMDSSSLMQGLNLSVMFDFLNEHGDGFGTILSQVTWTVLAFMLINTLLAGGILTVVRDRRDRFSASVFFGGCGTYFMRFLRLFFIFGLLLLVILSVLSGLFGTILKAITDNADSEITEYWARLAYLILFMIPAMIIVMIADYAKIMVVTHDEHSMLKTAWRSTKLTFRYFFRTFGLELLMVLVPIVLIVLYGWLDLTIGMTSGLTILVMFVLQQLFIVSKAWTKVFFFAGEMSLYHGLQPFGSEMVGSTFGLPDAQQTRV